MKPHIRKVRGIWTVRECICVCGWWNGPPFTPRHVYFGDGGPIGHGYTVREAYEDWKAQMQAQRALPPIRQAEQ